MSLLVDGEACPDSEESRPWARSQFTSQGDTGNTAVQMRTWVALCVMCVGFAFITEPKLPEKLGLHSPWPCRIHM